MKTKFTIILLLLLLPLCRSVAQTTLYSQTFSSTLAASGWTSQNLTTPWGNQSSLGANQWTVSTAEAGFSAGNCGGSGSDASLFITHPLITGAAYLADINTNKRVYSPNISTSGYQSIILEFDFIGNGEGTSDLAYLQYSVDGGTTWIDATGAPTAVSTAMGSGGSLSNLKSQICASGQGSWTHLTWNMPSTCDNISNMKIAVVWRSNNNSVGTDPSFAMDDVTITGTIIALPVRLLNFAVNPGADGVADAKWSTATEEQNDHFTVQRSRDMSVFEDVGVVKGAGNSSIRNDYSFTDPQPYPGLSYYRLLQCDYNGDKNYSDAIPFVSRAPEPDVKVTMAGDSPLVTYSGFSGEGRISIYEISGRMIYSATVNFAGEGIIRTGSQPFSGALILRVESLDYNRSFLLMGK